MTKRIEDFLTSIGYDTSKGDGLGLEWEPRFIATKAFEAAAIRSGEPPQPRCPKCGNPDVRLEVYYHTVLINSEGRLPHLRVKCGGCAESYNDITFSDFAQFFGPFAPQPQPRWIRQEDQNGCVVAAIAMIVGKSYDEVKSELLPKDLAVEAYTSFDAESYLYEHGYTLLKKWKHIYYREYDRDSWPVLPFAPVHYVQVVNNPAGKAHAVVMLANGDVLDPLAGSKPTKLTDYNQVNEIIGIFSPSSPSGSAGQEPLRVKDFDWKCENCGFRDDPTIPGKPTICPKCGWNKWSVVEPEGRAESAAEPRKMVDVGGLEHDETPQCKYSSCKPVVSASPAPARSHPHMQEVSQGIFTSAVCTCPNQADEDGSQCPICGKSKVAVAPVSGNGTEPPCFKCGKPATKIVTNGAFVCDKHSQIYAVSMPLAGAASHNGQGCGESVLGKIVRVDNPRFNGFGFATADTGERKRVISVLLENGNVWDYDAKTVRVATPEEIKLVPHKIRSLLPAPPSEDDGPQPPFSIRCEACGLVYKSEIKHDCGAHDFKWEARGQGATEEK